MYKRLNNLYLCTKAIIARLFSHKRVSKIPRRVLIVQMAKLGDMVCTTPMFRAVKNQYPSCEVWVMGNRVNKELLESNLDIEGYIVFSNFKKTLEKIKSLNFDFACTAGPNFEALVMFCLARISVISTPRIINGWSPYETKPYKILSKFVISKTHRMGSYAPREYLRLLEAIGIFSDETKKYLAYSDEAKNSIELLLEDNNLSKKDFIVGITPSAGNKIKEWPVERFVEVAKYIIDEADATILILGGPDDTELCQKMSKNLPQNRFIDTSGKFSIDELKALIKELDLFISVDTGPIYIAEAFGIPTIDIVGPMDENEQPPKGDKHIIILPPGRVKPELHIMNARVYNIVEAKKSVNDITVHQVKRAFDKLWQRI